MLPLLPWLMWQGHALLRRCRQQQERQQAKSDLLIGDFEELEHVQLSTSQVCTVRLLPFSNLQDLQGGGGVQRSMDGARQASQGQRQAAG